MALPLDETIVINQNNHLQDHNDIHDVVNRIDGLILNVKDFGATGNGTTDDTAAFQAAVDAAPVHAFMPAVSSTSRVEHAATIFVPSPSNYYRLTSQITLPSTKQLTIRGPSFGAPRLHMDNGAVPYIFHIGSTDQNQRAVTLENLIFRNAGVSVRAMQGRYTVISSCVFNNCPQWCIETLGDVVVGMLIEHCRLSECNNGISIGYQQSDNIWIEDCDFIRNKGTDLRIRCAGVHVDNCDWEVRDDSLTNYANPCVQIDKDPVTSAVPGTDVQFSRCRFGNETSPPRDLVIFGALNATVDSSLYGNVWFDKCTFRGANGGVPTSTQGRYVFVMNNPVRLRVTNSTFGPYDKIVQENYLSNATAQANMQHVVWEDNTFASAPVTALFSGGGRGIHTTDDPLVRLGARAPLGVPRPVENLLARTDNIESATEWTKTNLTVAKNATGPDGVANSGYTLTRSGTGVARLQIVAAAVSGGVATASVWLKAGTETQARLLMTGTTNNLPITLTSNWQRYRATAYGLADAATPTLSITSGTDSGTGTPTILMAFPQFEAGPDASNFIANPDTAGALHAVRQFQGLALGQRTIGYGSTAPASGRYEVGDIVLSSAPVPAGKIGWTCVTAGAPGTWVEFGHIGGHEEALKPTAALFETFPRAGSTIVNAATITTGKLWLQAVNLPAGMTITSLTFRAGATAVVTPTNQWFALYDSSRNLLRQTTDDTTAAWNATGAKTLTLTSTFTTTYSGLHYVGLMVAATTVPTLLVVSSSSAVTGVVPILSGMTADTGLTTTAPDPAGAITAAGAQPWAYGS